MNINDFCDVIKELEGSYKNKYNLGQLSAISVSLFRTEFKENIKSHINIADISKECESIIKQFINKQKFDDLSPVKLGKIRLEAREKISDNLKKIDTILTKL